MLTTHHLQPFNQQGEHMETVDPGVYNRSARHLCLHPAPKIVVKYKGSDQEYQVSWCEDCKTELSANQAVLVEELQTAQAIAKNNADVLARIREEVRELQKNLRALHLVESMVLMAQAQRDLMDEESLAIVKVYRDLYHAIDPGE